MIFCGFYGVDDDELAGRLFALATRRVRAKGWWQDYTGSRAGDRAPNTSVAIVALEQEATSILGYEGDLIHGLMQTEEYADALLDRARLRRQDRTTPSHGRVADEAASHLARTRPVAAATSASVVMGEAAILRPVGSHKIMQRQLQAIRELVEERSDNVDLRVMPLAAGSARGPRQPVLDRAFRRRQRIKTSCTWKARRAEPSLSGSRTSSDSPGFSQRCKRPSAVTRAIRLPRSKSRSQH